MKLIDVVRLEKKFEKLFETETPKSFNEWLKKKRKLKKNINKKTGDGAHYR